MNKEAIAAIVERATSGQKPESTRVEATAPALTAEDLGMTDIERERSAMLHVLGLVGFRKKQLGQTFDAYVPQEESQKAAVEICQAFANDWPDVERGLILMGKTGTGKTHLAAATLREILTNEAVESGGWSLTNPVRMIRKYAWFRVPWLLNEYRDRRFESGAKLRERALTCDLLVLDELGAENATDFALDLLTDILGERYEEERPTVITINQATAGELKGRYGDRILSRFAGAYKRIRFTGDEPDWRTR